MKKSLVYFLALSSVVMTGCVAEEPFADGDGQLSMKMVINGAITRSADDEEALAQKCIVYISNDKGLIRKYEGMQNVPDRIPFKAGSYIAEAWTGDSVSASFDKKFYRAYEPFVISSGTTEVTLNCKIANVVASVNEASIDADAMRDWTITIGNTRASLDFTQDNVADAKGYYMMPNGETELTWTITGKNAAGVAFTKTGIIENVERAHEYILNLGYNPAENPNDVGGAFITVTIDDRELLIEDEVVFLGKPVVKGIDFEIDKPIVAEPGTYTDKLIAVYAFGHLTALELNIPDYEQFGLKQSNVELLNLSQAAENELRAAGLSWTVDYNGNADTSTAYITFSAAMLNRLPRGSYDVTIKPTDSYGKYSAQIMNLNPTDAKVAAEESVWNEVYAYHATLRGSVLKDGVTNLAIRYRKAGTQDWTIANFDGTANAGSTFAVEVSGLQPGTTYEYQAVADGEANTTSKYFTTEAIYAIPNAGFEEWSASGKVTIPGAGGSVTFWDSGNHGSSMMSKTLTQSATAPKHSGNYSAELKSQFVGIGSIGKFAAGNIFTGTYDGTDGTDGILTFGRAYNASRPVKLAGWANYRPGVVDSKASVNGYLTTGDSDKAQIYVALTTEPYKILTKNQQQLFNPNAETVLAYGQITFDKAFGNDGELQRFEITLDYRASSKSVRPAYLVIVGSASIYGDYFCGGEGSTLYLDDLELIYE